MRHVHSNGSQEHHEQCIEDGQEWETDPETIPGTTRYNQSLVLPNNTVHHEFRPDLQRMRKVPKPENSNDKVVVDVREYQSRSQSLKELYDKMQRIKEVLGDFAGRLEVIPYPWK